MLECNSNKPLAFVYGTLMKDRRNHHYLEDSKYIGSASLEGYGLYHLGSYPGIKPLKDAKVLGEVYEVDADTLSKLDELEGEGYLYKKQLASILMEDSTALSALVYIYLKEVNDSQLLGIINQPWSTDRSKNYIWYVSYGSNMLYERLLCYIQGGVCSYNRRKYGPCSDRSEPLQKRNVTIPYNMYYGNSSGSWGNKGVSFVDSSKPGSTLGVAYLITKGQLQELQYFEGRNWYNQLLYLDPIDGYGAVTLTSSILKPINEPSYNYKQVIFDGIKENYKELSDVEVKAYIDSRNSNIEK